MNPSEAQFTVTANNTPVGITHFSEAGAVQFPEYGLIAAYIASLGSLGGFY